MAIAVTETRRKARDAGFTLVEILCVLALLGLTAGLVVLNLPKPTPPVRTEMQMLVTTFNLAARESVIDGKIRAVDFTQSGVEFLRYDGEWVPDTRRDFADISRIALDVEGESVDLKARSKAKSKSDDILPPLIQMDATGNVTPFKLTLSGQGQGFVVSPNPRGKIVIEVAR